MSLAEPKTSTVSPESPWLGLRPFTEGVREYFFGRDAEVGDIFQRVVHKPLTVLFGRSGLGKTSLLQAALVPRLRDAGFLPIVLRLDYAEGAAPLLQQFVDALIAAFAPVLPGLDASLTRIPADASLPWLLFHDPEFGLTAPESPRPVVLLDQFEEIFTMGQATSERQAAAAEFLEMLADLVENRVPESLRALLETDDTLAERLDYAARPAKVLLSLREDFLHMLERYRGRMPALMDNRFELRLLTGPQALEAVIEPGRLRCVPGTDLAPLVSEATGGAIVRFVAGVAPDIPLAEIDAVPPLLSLLCAELNEQRLAAGESVIRPGQLEGRAEDILKQFYERCFAPQPAAVRAFVEDRLLSAAGFRESTTLDTATDELVRKGGLTEVAAAQGIAQLVDARLLTSEERSGIRRIELTHDILTSVARRSRDARLEREAAARRRRQRTRFIGLIVGLALLLAAVSVPLAVWALQEAGKATKARQSSNRVVDYLLNSLSSKMREIGHDDVIEAALGVVERELNAPETPQGAPDVRYLKAVAKRVSADVLLRRGRITEALDAASTSILLVESIASGPDDVRASRVLSEALLVRGRIRCGFSLDVPGGEKDFERAIALRKAILANPRAAQPVDKLRLAECLVYFASTDRDAHPELYATRNTEAEGVLKSYIAEVPSDYFALAGLQVLNIYRAVFSTLNSSVAEGQLNSSLAELDNIMAKNPMNAEIIEANCVSIQLAAAKFADMGNYQRADELFKTALGRIEFVGKIDAGLLPG